MKTAIAVAVAAAVVTAGVVAHAEMAKASTAVTQADIKYVTPFGDKGPQFGFVEGMINKLGTPTSMFIKFPAGGDSGWHIHDNDYQGVVIKGNFGEQQLGAGENDLPQGTYFTQVAKKPHRNYCKGTEDCFLFVHFPKGANSIPTTPEGKVIPPKKQM